MWYCRDATCPADRQGTVDNYPRRRLGKVFYALLATPFKITEDGKQARASSMALNVAYFVFGSLLQDGISPQCKAAVKCESRDLVRRCAIVGHGDSVWSLTE